MAAFFRMGKELNGADGTGGKFWKAPLLRKTAVPRTAVRLPCVGFDPFPGARPAPTSEASGPTRHQCEK